MPRPRSYPNSTYAKPKRTPLTKPTPGNTASRFADRGHEHRRTKQMSNAHGQGGSADAPPARTRAASTSSNQATQRTKQTPQAAALRAHGHRNDTADMMKTVAHADGSHRAPTNKPKKSLPKAPRPGMAPAPTKAKAKAQVQTSASGAKYVMTPSGKKRYLGKKAR